MLHVMMGWDNTDITSVVGINGDYWIWCVSDH
jgi:hypothetical protein